MKLIEIRRYEMLVRVNAFGVAHADAFPASSGGGQLFAALNTVVGALEAHVVAQAGSKNAAREGSSAKTAAGDHLRQQLTTLARTAKVATAGTPGLAEKFRVPKSHSEQRLVAAARAMVQDATPFADAIVSHNLPPTFFADVTAAIDSFEASIQAHATAKEARAAAGAGITQELAAGRTIVRQLDSVVPNQCGGDVPALAEWKAARRVLLFNIPIRRQPAEPSPAPMPTPVPQPA